MDKSIIVLAAATFAAGDKVKVGFDSGLISNTAYVVLEEGTAMR